jgi:hypothetical protein
MIEKQIAFIKHFIQVIYKIITAAASVTLRQMAAPSDSPADRNQLLQNEPGSQDPLNSLRAAKKTLPNRRYELE